jgi:CPA1 family monovalent cation:H+ antiporter
MEAYSVVIVLLALAIGLSTVASKTKIPYPIVLLVAGIIVGFVPQVQRISIDPEVVFLIFLPPMLYEAAFNTSFQDFKTYLSTISLLAVTLVFATTTLIAVAVHYYVPFISWPIAFILGAILSPPDAVAAISLTKGVVPHKVGVILEGESLVNDASALVAFRFAVAAVAGGSFVVWEAGAEFIIALAGGFLIGIVAWLLFAQVVSRGRFNNDSIISLNLLLPFAAYLVAQQFDVSGVIAVVTVGLCVTINKEKFSKISLIQSKIILQTAMFTLGALIFMLIGLELPFVVQNIPSENIAPLLKVAVIIFLMALAVRMAVMFGRKFQIDFILYRARKQGRVVHRRYNKRVQLEPISAKECFIIGWAGMRGIVSLACALSLPVTMADGEAFPHRDAVIFVTTVVVVMMLVIQGLALPFLIKILKIQKD